MKKEQAILSKQAVLTRDWLHFKHYALISFVLFLGCLLMANPVHAKQIQDIDITLAIENELLGDEAVDANHVDIETQQGVVSFTGKVEHLLAKERVEKIAENVVGVRAVINRLEVKPRLDVTDTELQKAIENALLLDPATDAYEVAATVNKGVVILTGSVDSWQERHLCEKEKAKGCKMYPSLSIRRKR